MTTDRIEPTAARRIRFTIHATNSLEPCIDELEVFDGDGRNVALASNGTTVRTSGDTLCEDQHDPAYINDGVYGNSRSWLGNISGQGWVELTFNHRYDIQRLVWSRDREGPFEDRLTTDYTIEASAEESGDSWKLVADSSDRRKWLAGMDLGPQFVLGGLSAEETTSATRLLDEKKKLETQIRSLEAGQLAFAGKFRAPDEIYLLKRGDPEQPGEPVAPATLSAFDGQLTLQTRDEQARRAALARWITDPSHPLTARVMVNRIWQATLGQNS